MRRALLLAVFLACCAPPAPAEQSEETLGQIKIDLPPGVLEAHLKAQQRPEKDYTQGAIAVMLVLVGFGLYFHSKKEAPVVITTAVPVSGLLPGAEAYAIKRSIGQGGMGVVYEAVDRTLDRKVAIKKMRDELKEHPEDVAQFVKEAKTVAALHHPNIVDIHAIVAQAGEVYLVFEFVEGRTVDALLAERKRLSLAEAKSILQPVCAALAFAHERKVIHRDLKPSNIMITEQGFVKVMDFGIATQLKDKAAAPAPAPAPEHSRIHLTNAVRGTLLYMAPEADFGIVRPESDVYALGVMLYEMLAGQAPYPAGTTRDQKELQSYRRLAELSLGLSPAVDELVASTLNVDAEKRPRTPSEFWTRLAALA